MNYVVFEPLSKFGFQSIDPISQLPILTKEFDLFCIFSNYETARELAYELKLHNSDGWSFRILDSEAVKRFLNK